MDYNKTINLPKTDFPMRAGLPKREPEMLKRWQEHGRVQRAAEEERGQAPLQPPRRPSLLQRRHPHGHTP